MFSKLIPVASSCDLSHAEIAGLIPGGGMDICLLWVLCVFEGRILCDGLITRPGDECEGVILCDHMQDESSTPTVDT